MSRHQPLFFNRIVDKAELDGSELPADLFMELASETRCSMLLMLDEQPRRSTELAEKLNMTVQEAHRNTSRLMESGIIEKDSDGLFYITEYGKVITRQISYFQFLKDHRHFFEEHTLGDIPVKFKQRMGALQNCVMVNSANVVFEKLKEIMSSANKYLKVMVYQAWPEEGRIFADRAKNGVQVSVIVGRNTIFPKTVVETVVKELNELEKLSQVNLERRMVDRVAVSVFVTDDRSAVIFPNLKGEVDYRMLLISDDLVFNEWCLDLFDYNWERSKPFDVYKAKIVE
jgi:predicted transcriptional regulator